jgi:hypothetical protein
MRYSLLEEFGIPSSQLAFRSRLTGVSVMVALLSPAMSAVAWEKLQ